MASFNYVSLSSVTNYIWYGTHLPTKFFKYCRTFCRNYAWTSNKEKKELALQISYTEGWMEARFFISYSCFYFIYHPWILAFEICSLLELLFFLEGYSSYKLMEMYLYILYCYLLTICCSFELDIYWSSLLYFGLRLWFKDCYYYY